MNHDLTRTCPFCLETVRAAAKVCPRCRQWLSLRSLRHPVIGLLVTVIPMLIVWIALGAAAFARFDRLFNPRPFYSESPEALQVAEPRMNWVETTNGPRLYVTGILTNRSAVPWREVEFDCRFFDTNGVMVDASNAHSGATVPPHDDSAFRAIVVPGRPAGDYASIRLSVNTARNARSGF